MIKKLDCGFWVVEGDTHRTKWVEEKGSLNIDGLIDKICKLLSPGDVVVDVGANIGDHTYFYRQSVGEKGEVIAFEPDPECFACCVLNCGTFKNMYQAAATDHSAELGILIQPNRGQNFIDINGKGVRGFPIDDLELKRCNLIKIDTEGSEEMVLRGARRTIERLKPLIVIECIESQLVKFSSSVDRILKLIASQGYIIEDIGSGGKNKLCRPLANRSK